MRGFERRLTRAAKAVHRRVGPILEREREEAECRIALRCEVALADAIRKYRPPGYESAALERVLKDGEWAAEDLAEIPDTPELRDADEALFADEDISAELEALRAEFAELVERFANGQEPDPEKASLTEMLAFCLARAGVADEPAPANGAAQA
jgi:hypothetical protein